jgi:hypothetical protein
MQQQSKTAGRRERIAAQNAAIVRRNMPQVIYPADHPGRHEALRSVLAGLRPILVSNISRLPEAAHNDVPAGPMRRFASSHVGSSAPARPDPRRQRFGCQHASGSFATRSAILSLEQHDKSTRWINAFVTNDPLVGQLLRNLP